MACFHPHSPFLPPPLFELAATTANLSKVYIAPADATAEKLEDFTTRCATNGVKVEASVDSGGVLKIASYVALPAAGAGAAHVDVNVVGVVEAALKAVFPSSKAKGASDGGALTLRQRYRERQERRRSHRRARGSVARHGGAAAGAARRP